MSRFIVIGIVGNDSLSLVDVQEGTVRTISRDALDPSIASLRESGATTFRGVDVAIAIEDLDEAVGRFFFDGGVVR